MDVKTSSGGWETMRSSVGNVVGKGAWGKGVIDDLKDITKNLEKAEEKISAKDEDGVVSFHHLDRTTTYQEIYEKMEVLYGFTNKAHDLVDETIDEKFYQEIDKYAVAMRDLTINKYSTKNITGATKQELVFTSSSMQEMQTVSKDKITVDDLFSDSSPLGKKMKADFDQYRLSQGDKKTKYEDFKQSMLNTGAFEYTSIKDKQMKKEMWVNLGIAAVIVIASIAFPPAGMALGLVVSSLEVGSAITGKDWVSGRELGTGERVFRGVLGGVGLGTELYALNSFSKNVRLVSQIKYGGEGATSVQHLGDMVANSGKSSYGRVTEFRSSIDANDIVEIKRIDEKTINFKFNDKYDYDEFMRQLKNQEKGMNDLSIDEFLKNRENYKLNGRSTEANKLQKEFREIALADKIEELMETGVSFNDANSQAKDWLKDLAVLHDPDQVAGGNPLNLTGLGDKGVNSSIGSQWQYKIKDLEEFVLHQSQNMTELELKETFLNIIMDLNK